MIWGVEALMPESQSTWGDKHLLSAAECFSALRKFKSRFLDNINWQVCSHYYWKQGTFNKLWIKSNAMMCATQNAVIHCEITFDICISTIAVPYLQPGSTITVITLVSLVFSVYMRDCGYFHLSWLAPVFRKYILQIS